MQKYVMLLGILLSSSVTAQVYKCTVAGKTVYADSPCSANASVVTIMPGPAAPTEDELKAKASSAEKTNKAEISAGNRRALEALEEDIGRAEDRLRTANYQKEKSLAQLEDKKQRANNNLAGAMWEQSVSIEMQSVRVSYDGKINQIQSHLDRLREQRSRMDQENS